MRRLAVQVLAIGLPLGSFVALKLKFMPPLWLGIPDAVLTAGVLIRTFVSRQRYLSVKHRTSCFEFSPGGLQHLADSVGLSIPDLAQPIAGGILSSFFGAC